jgi:hypothetical protein
LEFDADLFLRLTYSFGYVTVAGKQFRGLAWLLRNIYPRFGYRAVMGLAIGSSFTDPLGDDWI